MTEDEARDLQCCGPDGCGKTTLRFKGEGQFEPIPGMSRRCIASACMAWRKDFDDTRVVFVHAKAGGKYFTNIENFKENPNSFKQVWETSGGYCGLAGERFPK